MLACRTGSAGHDSARTCVRMSAVHEAITEGIQPAVGLTNRYQVVTDSGSLRGEPSDAVTDDHALDVVRARRRAGNLPLAPF